jgi:hypothetical protein
MDCDYPGIGGGAYIDYKKRAYDCPDCDYSGVGYKVRQKSPPEFLLQPHQMSPMSQRAFDYWAGILRANFPDHPRVAQLGKGFYPNTAGIILGMKAWLIFVGVMGVALLAMLIKALLA